MSTSRKYDPAVLRWIAQYVIRQRNAGSPRYEVFLLVLMMRLGVFDRHGVEQQIEELAK